MRQQDGHARNRRGMSALPVLTRNFSAVEPLKQMRVTLHRWYRKPYTRFGVYRLVERCANQVPALARRRITPHVLRHTAARELVRAEVDTNTIRAWLGHASIDTTNIYAEIDLEMKAKALALCDAAEPGPDRPWNEEKGLMALLKSL